jgi:predicted HTH domain antitoxin
MPDQVVDRYGGEASAAVRISKAAAMELLREGELTSGEAAEALNMTRRRILEIMAERNIPVANYDPVELQEELQTLQRIGP